MTQAVVLLHALATTPRMWSAQRESLTAAGHRVLVPPLLDADDLTGEPSIPALADRLASLLDRAGEDRVALVACSMGGYVALEFLRRHPSRVGALALMATRVTADDAESAAARRRFATAVLDPATGPQLAVGTAPSLLGATSRSTRPDLLAEVMDLVHTVPREEVAWCQRATAGRADGTDVLAGYSGPATVLAGMEDELVGVHEAERVAGLCGTPLITVPRAGHLLPLEAAPVVTAALHRMLDGITEPPTIVRSGQ